MSNINFKYTTDGKKVVVVGNLNSKEIIVQEIFITTSGAEIPGGENFIVKSLLDEPAKTWREKRLSEEEAYYEQAKSRIDSSMQLLKRSHDDAKKTIQGKIDFIKGLSKNDITGVFDTIISFINDEFKYAVKLTHYGDFDIVDFDKLLLSEYGLKMITIFGSSGGNLNYGVNQYGDGYNYKHTEIVPCKTEEEALGILKQKIHELNSYTAHTIKCSKKYNIPLDENKVKAFIEKETESFRRNIKQHKESIKKFQESIKETESLVE